MSPFYFVLGSRMYVETRPDKRTSKVWNYFNSIDDKREAECKFCLHRFKIDSGTNNMRRHLTERHGLKEEDLK